MLQPFLEDEAPLTQLTREHGVPLRTSRRWVQQYRQDGLAGLARAARADCGQRRLPANLQLLIEGLALKKPRPSAASIARQVRPVEEAQGWPIPSYSTVYAVLRQLDPALVTLAQEGSKVYRDRFDLLYRREASRPNEIWQADHTPLDIWIVDDRGQPARPWLTAIIDDYSRAIASFRVGLEAPTALGTALTLRQGIWRKADPRWQVCGIPGVFYTDHGSDFTSDHLEQVAVDLKMQLVFSMVGEPRGRGRIERFFETVNQLCLSELPGYRPADSPRGTPIPTPVLTLAQLEARLEEFVLDRYHRRIHGETGVTPQARWEAGGFLPRLPDSLEQLDLLLLTVRTPRRIHQDGIRFQGLCYLDLTLAAYVGESVTIRYDPRDLAEIRVYHQDRFLCRAVCQELAGLTISLKEIVQARRARQRQLREGLVQRSALVTTFLPPPTLPSPPDLPPAPEAPPRLKRYFNE
ncbi:MAG: transposase [Chloroflexi bacterium]|nr:transposase [Chloroflexota bacterium]